MMPPFVATQAPRAPIAVRSPLLGPLALRAADRAAPPAPPELPAPSEPPAAAAPPPEPAPPLAAVAVDTARTVPAPGIDEPDFIVESFPGALPADGWEIDQLAVFGTDDEELELDEEAASEPSQTFDPWGEGPVEAAPSIDVFGDAPADREEAVAAAPEGAPSGPELAAPAPEAAAPAPEAAAPAPEAAAPFESDAELFDRLFDELIAGASDEEPAPEPGPPARPAAADPRRVEEIAARLERIARALRERGPSGPLAEEGADPLGALVAGYLLGLSDRRPDPDPDRGDRHDPLSRE